jgi:hypothetical protein
MDLKTFVSWVLTEIDEWLKEASKKYNEYNFNYWSNSSWNPTIDFEVQVYAWDWTWTNGGIWINVAGIKLWTEWESSKSNYELSKISFSIVRENTPEQMKKEKEERIKYLQKPYVPNNYLV